MKFFVLFFVCVLSALAVKAQSETNVAALTGPEDGINQLKEKGLANLRARILAANLPDDLQVRAEANLQNAENQLDACQTAYENNLIVWQYKVCVISQIRVANIVQTQLESEAEGRQNEDTETAF